MLSLSRAVWFIHIMSVSVHTVGVSKQGRGRVAGKLKYLSTLATYLWLASLQASCIHNTQVWVFFNFLPKTSVFVCAQVRSHLYLCLHTIWLRLLVAAEQDGVIWSSNFSFCSSLPSKSAALSYLPSPFVHNVKAATFKPEPTVTTIYWMYFLFVCLFFFPFSSTIESWT